MEKLALAVLSGVVLVLGIVRFPPTEESDDPISVLIVESGLHSKEGIGRTSGISVINPATIAELSAFFPGYRKQPSSRMASSWEAGHYVYFNHANGRTIRVTVSGKGGGDTWSVGKGDFDTKGKFGRFVETLCSRIPE